MYWGKSRNDASSHYSSIMTLECPYPGLGDPQALKHLFDGTMLERSPTTARWSTNDCMWDPLYLTLENEASGTSRYCCATAETSSPPRPVVVRAVFHATQTKRPRKSRRGTRIKISWKARFMRQKKKDQAFSPVFSCGTLSSVLMRWLFWSGGGLM